MHPDRRRPLRLAVLLVVFALVTAACSGGGDGDGTTGNTSNAIKEGGTLSYAADQEPTGFNNNNTAKDNGTSVRNVVINLFPPVFRLHPDYSVQLNQDLMDSAEQTSADPQTIVYKIKQNAVWSDGTPVTADDFEYLWKNLDGSITSNDVAATTPCPT